MANFNSTQYANNVTVPPTLNVPRDLSGRKRVMFAEYSTPASAGPAAGDALVVGKLPAGARVTSAEVMVPASFVTSSSKIGYGSIAADGTVTAVDDDRWGAGKDLSSAGRIQYLTVAADIGYETTSEVAVILTFTTGNPAASKDIAVLIEYVVD